MRPDVLQNPNMFSAVRPREVRNVNISLCVVDFSLPLDLDLGFVRLENGDGVAFEREEEEFEDGSEERRGKKNGWEVSGVKEEELLLLFVLCCCCCCC